MKLISWIWFWYILVGFLMGGGAVLMWHYLKNISIKLKWFEWILSILAFITFMFMYSQMGSWCECARRQHMPHCLSHITCTATCVYNDGKVAHGA